MKLVVFTLLELLDIGIIDRLYNITQKPLGGSWNGMEIKAWLTNFFGWVGILSVRTTEGEARLLDGIGVLSIGPAEGEACWLGGVCGVPVLVVGAAEGEAGCEGDGGEGDGLGAAPDGHQHLAPAALVPLLRPVLPRAALDLVLGKITLIRTKFTSN